MEIQEFSDIHTDQHQDNGLQFCRDLDPTGVDVLVIAGDFCPWELPEFAYQKFEILAAKYPKLIFVPGNHEYWHAPNRDAVTYAIHQLEVRFPNITVLDNSETVIDGVKFVGGTLWFPQPTANLRTVATWSDFHQIQNARPWIYDRHENFKQLLASSRDPDVVVTHHLPSFQCVSPRYAGDPTNHFYASNLDALIVEKKPKLWFYGHTHGSADFQLGSTRMVCNPFGYSHEPQQRLFNRRLIIEP